MRQVQRAGLSSEPSRVQGNADMDGAEGPAGWDAGVASRATSTSPLGGDSQMVLRTVSPVSKVLRLAKGSRQHPALLSASTSTTSIISCLEYDKNFPRCLPAAALAQRYQAALS